MIKQVQRSTYNVIPPPALPQPPARAFAVPTIFLSKNPVHQTWHGTKVPPRIPTKKRRAIRPLGVVTRPAMAVGIDPQSSSPINTRRGPNLSQRGPATNLTSRLAHGQRMSIYYQECGGGQGLRRKQSNNVRVCYLRLCHVKILANRVGQLDEEPMSAFVHACVRVRNHLPTVERHTTTGKPP